MTIQDLDSGTVVPGLLALPSVGLIRSPLQSVGGVEKDSQLERRAAEKTTSAKALRTEGAIPRGSWHQYCPHFTTKEAKAARVGNYLKSELIGFQTFLPNRTHFRLTKSPSLSRWDQVQGFCHFSFTISKRVPEKCLFLLY